MYRDVDFESYMFRIINFTNKGTDLKSLPRLLDIYRKIDMKNILRLKSTDDTIELAKSICDIVFKMVDEAKSNDDGTGENNEEREGGDDIDSKSGSSSNGEGTEIDTGDNEMTPDDNSIEGEEISDAAKNAVKRLFGKEKELLDGKTPKTKNY